MTMQMQNTWQPHFVLIPLMAQGHMIPMIDIAKLLAQRGVIVTLVTTPHNASRFEQTILRAIHSGLPIRLLEIPFPCQQVGLPAGCENLDMLPSKTLLPNFYAALETLRQPLEHHLQNTTPPPTCIISDKYLHWTSLVAKNLDIPRLVFHGTCCFSLLCTHNIKLHHAQNSSLNSGSEEFSLPGLPQYEIQIKRSQIVTMDGLEEYRVKIREAELSAYGVVANSFEELETGFDKEYEKAIDKKVWCIGPVSSINKDYLDKADRGNKSSIDREECLNWLDSMKHGSVIYASLGSLCRLVPSQLMELGLGLEASGKPFIWAFKTTADEKYNSELEKLLKDVRFEERVKGRGLLIKGWAPQVLILSHPAIGSFLTHCGWNSTIEGVCSGVPMITWPMFSEQFFNEQLIVHVLGIGVRIGVQVPVKWGEEEKVGILVGKDEVKKAIEVVMCEDEEGDSRRDRAARFGELARKATEPRGSSYINVSSLIQDIMEQSH